MSRSVVLSTQVTSKLTIALSVIMAMSVTVGAPLAWSAPPLLDQRSTSPIRTFDEGALLKSTTPEPLQGSLMKPVEGCLIGAITLNQQFSDSAPNGYCVEGVYYQGASARLGQLNLFGAGAEALKQRRELVMISAVERPDLWRQLQRGEACPKRDTPIMQFRSDWYALEGGYENSQARLAQSRYLELTSPQVTPLKLLKIDRPGGGLSSQECLSRTLTFSLRLIWT